MKKLALIFILFISTSAVALAQGNGNSYGNSSGGNGNGNGNGLGNGNGNAYANGLGGSGNGSNSGSQGNGNGNNGNGNGNGGSNSGGSSSGSSSSGSGVSDCANQNVNVALSNAIEITFTGTGGITGTDVSIPFTTVNDYANGVETATQELKIRSNKNFTVEVKTNSANFSYTGSTSPSPTMPVNGVLGVMVSANSTGGSIGSNFSSSAYNTLKNSDQDLITSGSRGGNQKFSIKYKATPGFAYPAGTYTVDVVYTATQD